MSFRKWNHPRVLVHLLVVRKKHGHHNFYVFLETKSFDTSTLSQKHEEHRFTWARNDQRKKDVSPQPGIRESDIFLDHPMCWIDEPLAFLHPPQN